MRLQIPTTSPSARTLPPKHRLRPRQRQWPFVQLSAEGSRVDVADILAAMGSATDVHLRQARAMTAKGQHHLGSRKPPTTPLLRKPQTRCHRVSPIPISRRARIDPQRRQRFVEAAAGINLNLGGALEISTGDSRPSLPEFATPSPGLVTCSKAMAGDPQAATATGRAARWWKGSG